MPGAPSTSLGIDIGGTSAKLAVRTGDGAERRLATAAYASPSLEELARVVRAGLEGLGFAGADALRVGCCVPGKFALGAGGRADTVAYSANLPCLNGVDVGAFVGRLTGVEPGRVAVLPDAIATALGSHAARPAPGRLLCLAMGTGVGAALLVDGRPVTVAPGSVGHLGQVDVSLSEDAPVGPDGGRGSLEAYVGLPALRARFGESRERLREAIGAMGEGDPALRALARAIRIAHALYTPDEVRLLGGVGVLLSERLDTIAGLVNRDLTGVANAGWTLHAGDDPYYAAVGAMSACSPA
ncbi:MAG: ROK family protein [Phycisphaerales bacterium JB040]